MVNWATSEELLAQANRLQGLLLTIPMSKVRFGMMVVIVVWFLSLMADIVWLLVPSPDVSTKLALSQVKPSSRQQLQTSTADSTVDVNAMKEWHLFGSAEVEKVEEDQADKLNVPDQYSDILEEAEETRLQLKLLGVMVSDVGLESQAVIEHQSTSELYKVGDSVPGGRDVTLAWVLADRVIIDNRGVRESLMLYDDSESAGVQETDGRSNKKGRKSKDKSARGSRKKVLDQRDNDRLSDMANDYRKQLLNNPMSLADVIKVSVAKDADGSVIGYRIRPGKDRKQFSEFGLKSGDIVTSINGLSLDDPAKAMELYGQLREAKEASFVVKRGNEEINLILGLSE